MPPRSRAPARQGTALQGSSVSYYSAPGQGQVVTTSGGMQARRRGQVVQARTSSGQQLQGRVPAKTYHRVVLAEFVVTILIIGASPIVVPQKQAAAADAEAAAATVTFAGPLIRLTATCVIFFVLALMATGQKTGKVAAAFGALVMVGAMINATDLWTALGHALGAGGGKAG